MATINDLKYEFFKGVTDSQSPSGAITVRNSIARAIENGVLYAFVDTESGVIGGATIDFGIEMVGGTPMGAQTLLLTAQVPNLAFEIYEAAEFSGGSQINTVNTNRLVPDPDPDKNTVITLNPTISTPGNLLIQYNYVGENNGGQIGSFVTAATATPFVFNPLYKYILRVVNTSTDTGDVEVALVYVDR